MFDGEVSIKYREEVLGSNSMSSFIEQDVAKLLARLIGSEERKENDNLGDSIKGTSVD